MSSVLVTGIGELVTCDGTGPDGIGSYYGHALAVDGDTITWVGPANRAPDCDRMIGVEGRCVLPAFVDSHTHLVFAGDRSAEFAARMSGRGYDGGGIRDTVEATRAASDADLECLVRQRITEARNQGTGTIEIKSGYGLNVAGEARLLRIASEVTTETTYLGAHVVPQEYQLDRAGYLDLVCGEMLDACAPHARWVDVFCEPHSRHAFDAEEARTALTSGQRAGLLARVHANQLGPGPGVQLAVELGAASADHCTYLSATDVEALSGSQTVATLLPGVEFSTRSQYPDGAALLAAGVRIALATDCNPGTCYSSSMPFMIALAVREMGLSPGQAVVAATRGGAEALRRNDIGAIVVGNRGELTVLDAPNHLHLSYRAGVPLARVLQL